MSAREQTLFVSSETLSLAWPDGSVTELPHLWLRDNCPCDECRSTQTTEKRFLITSVPADLAPTQAALIGDRLHLTWPDGHRSVYASTDLRGQRADPLLAWQPWGAEFQPRRFRFADFLGNDDVACKAIEEIAVHGALILADAPTARGTLEDLAPRLGPLREVLFDRIHDVQVDPAGYNVAHTNLALPPHNDFASYTWPPSVQALHMLANETPGGESIIVDGWAVVAGLRAERPDYFEILCATPVPFREFDDHNETYAVAPIVRCDTDGRVVHLRYSNQLMQPPDPGRPGVALFYRAYRELSRRLTDASAKATFRLHGGQILIVAAHRVLHAREAFTPSGRRHLQDAYFELDNVLNHRVMLMRRAEN